jgi:hypothetical protein
LVIAQNGLLSPWEKVEGNEADENNGTKANKASGVAKVFATNDGNCRFGYGRSHGGSSGPGGHFVREGVEENEF